MLHLKRKCDQNLMCTLELAPMRNPTRPFPNHWFPCADKPPIRQIIPALCTRNHWHIVNWEWICWKGTERSSYPNEESRHKAHKDKFTVRANKILPSAAECSRPLRAANRRLPTPFRNGGERQTPVIFTPRRSICQFNEILFRYYRAGDKPFNELMMTDFL